MLATYTHALIYMEIQTSFKKKSRFVYYMSTTLALQKHKVGADGGAFSDGPN